MRRRKFDFWRDDFLTLFRGAPERESENHLSNMSGSDLRIQIGPMRWAFFDWPHVPIPPPSLQFPSRMITVKIKGHLTFRFGNVTHAKIEQYVMSSGKIIDLKQGIRRRLRFALTKWRRVEAGNVLNFPPRT